MPSLPEDYYELLGVESTIAEADLRRAWRRLVLRWHPDRAGTETTPIFQQLVAAYSVLSDPAARAAYDRNRRLRRVSASSGGGSSASDRHTVRKSEPPAAAPNRRAPRAMLWRVSGPLESLLACRVARRAAPDLIELYLDEIESAEGGIVTVAMNVEIRCPACSKLDSKSPCAACAGNGKVEERFSAWLTIPPNVADGTLLDPSVFLPGMIARPTFRVRTRQ